MGFAALLLAVGILVAVACTTDESGGKSSTAPVSDGAESAASVAPTDTPFEGSGIDGGDPDFDLGTLVWQGYWLSRDHFGPFVMASGMGIPFEPPMDMMMSAMQMVAQNPEDVPAVPTNMVPLQAIFAAGDSDLANDPRDYEPLDFEAFRLLPESFDRTVSVRGQAQTMLKESQWAHTFASAHFGSPTDDFGAQQRFMGVMVNMLAQMQAQYAMKNLMGEDGLYRDANSGVDYIGNWVMLHALSDLAGLSADGRYANPDVQPLFEKAATDLFHALDNRNPESAQEAAAATRALVYRASTASDPSVRDAAIARARSIAERELTDYRADDIVGISAAIAGLITVAATDDVARYRDAADALFTKLSGDFDGVHGVFRSKDVYNVDDVAWIIGGLNWLLQQGNAETREAAGDMLLAFYESTISLAGMQLSAPPGKTGAMSSPWEGTLPSALYYHPANTPPPAMAGKLPVPAEEIRWDGGAWEVTSDRFVPGGAMHLANELNWLGPHLGSVPFPEVDRQS